MNEITIFTNEQFGDVRTVIRGGDPWFVAVDVCKALKLSNPTVAVDRLDTDEKAKFNLGLRGSDITIVNEPGLYSLVLGSRKQEAKEFKRWITHDVISSIRKHGMYATDELLDNLDVAIAAFQALKEEREKNKLLSERLTEQSQQIEEMQPKAEYYDAICDAETLTGIRETAKLLDIPERQFTKWLEENGYCFRNARKMLLPYAEKQKSGVFATKEFLYGSPDRRRAAISAKITPEGRTEILRRMGKVVLSKEEKLPSNPTDKKLYNVADVGKMLGVGRNTVYELISHGYLSAAKIGGWKVSRSAIDDFIRKYEGYSFKDMNNPKKVVQFKTPHTNPAQ